MKRTAFLFYFAIICLVIVLADVYLWVAATGSNATLEQSKAAYLNHYPAAFQNARMLTVFSIVLLGISGFLFLKYPKNGPLRIMAVILGLFSVILLLWKLFTLM